MRKTELVLSNRGGGLQLFNRGGGLRLSNRGGGLQLSNRGGVHSCPIEEGSTAVRVRSAEYDIGVDILYF